MWRRRRCNLLADFDPWAAAHWIELCHEIVFVLRDPSKPLLAASHGTAVGVALRSSCTVSCVCIARRSSRTARGQHRILTSCRRHSGVRGTYKLSESLEKSAAALAAIHRSVTHGADLPFEAGARDRA